MGDVPNFLRKSHQIEQSLKFSWFLSAFEIIARTSRSIPANALTFMSLGQWTMLTRSLQLSNSMSNTTSLPSEIWTIQIPNPLASNLLHHLLADFHHATRIAKNLCLLIVDMSPFLAFSQMLHINQILNLTSLSVLRSRLIILHSWGSKVLFRIHWIVSTIYLPNFPVSLIFP